jgi:phosphoribosylaminoimidazole synthetase
MEKNSSPKAMSYAKAGVNIDEGNALVSSISQLAESTNRPGADGKLGGFGAIFDFAKLSYKDPLLVSSTDGVGTKLKIAVATNRHTTIGIDLVAMCVNDIVAQGAEPLFFLDYFATGKLDKRQAYDVIAGIAQGCKQAQCALVGGETAEMPGMYNLHDYDVAGFVVGVVERDNLLPKIDEIQPGDLVIGLQSSGPHSNGYSLIRALLEQANISYDQPVPFASEYATWADLLLEPTLIYSSVVLPLVKNNLIKAIAHITGGGLLENLPRVLPDNVAVELHNNWLVPPIFTWIASQGVDREHMYRVFNMGIGMTIIVSREYADQVLKQIQQTTFKAQLIGSIIKRETEQQVLI